jgi:chorismate mutase
MSPKNKKKLDIIRKKLDQIDSQLLAIIKKRTFLVNKVVKLKENKSESLIRKEFPQYSKISRLSQ